MTTTLTSAAGGNGDRTKGGHIMSFTIKEGKCEVDVLDHYFLALPADTSTFAKTDLAKDRSRDLKAVEKR